MLEFVEVVVEDQKDNYLLVYFYIYSLYMKNNKATIKKKMKIKKKGKGNCSSRGNLSQLPPIDYNDIEIDTTPRQIKTARQIQREHDRTVKRLERTIKSNKRKDEREELRRERESDLLDKRLGFYRKRFAHYKQRENLTKLKELHHLCKTDERFKETDHFIELAEKIQKYINKLESERKNIAGKKIF